MRVSPRRTRPDRTAASSAKAIKNAIRVARGFTQNHVDVKIREKISDLHTREHASELLAQ